MELVEGPTLADRIAQGPLPIDEALPIAKQIAEALEAAAVGKQSTSAQTFWAFGWSAVQGSRLAT